MNKKLSSQSIKILRGRKKNPNLKLEGKTNLKILEQLNWKISTFQQKCSIFITVTHLHITNIHNSYLKWTCRECTRDLSGYSWNLCNCLRKSVETKHCPLSKLTAFPQHLHRFCHLVYSSWRIEGGEKLLSLPFFTSLFVVYTCHTTLATALPSLRQRVSSEAQTTYFAQTDTNFWAST